jgi:aminoglycoside 6'-N-acetyltransferase I
MSIVKADMTNLKELTNLAVLLFPDETYEYLLGIYNESLVSGKEFNILYQADGKYVGYMHIAIRSDYVNGTDTSPVVFIEAIYVLPEYRKRGIGREFIEYAERFATERGITQVASDCLIDNEQSEKFHKSCGFIEQERVICFVKNVREDL